MTDDQAKMLQEVHDFLFKPNIPGDDRTLARELTEVLQAYRSGRFVARFTLWLAGAVITIGAAWVTFRGGAE